MKSLQLYSESTLTDRYQTTVPETVRKVLRLNKRDKIRFTISSTGEVLVSKADKNVKSSDPLITAFLNFLATDMKKHPENIEFLTPDLLSRIESLTKGIDVNLDAPLMDEDE